MSKALIEHIVSNGISASLYFRVKLDLFRAFVNSPLNPSQLDYRIQFRGFTGTNAVEVVMKLAGKLTGKNKTIR